MFKRSVACFIRGNPKDTHSGPRILKALLLPCLVAPELRVARKLSVSYATTAGETGDNLSDNILALQVDRYGKM